MSFRVETIQVATGAPQFSFTHTCQNCGLGVWINTISKDPADYTYFCLNCKTTVPKVVIHDIIRYMKTHKPSVKPI